LPDTSTQPTKQTADRRYRGRFAPSPTGPLHFGSLVAAVASYLEARTAGGDWLLRIEDIDPPREVPGAGDAIVKSLAIHGFEWSEAVVYQSHRHDFYQQKTTQLFDAGLAYACRCSRRDVRGNALKGTMGPIYPGTCRRLELDYRPHQTAARLRTDNTTVRFFDQLQGAVSARIRDAIGDFIIARKDGLPAYALASTLDDDDQEISHVVRGIDLLPFTPAQIYLQQTLRLHQPLYSHVPLAVNREGLKFSKQTGASGLDNDRAGENLYRCLAFLNQSPPANLAKTTVHDVWQWAEENWRAEHLTGLRKKAVKTSNL